MALTSFLPIMIVLAITCFCINDFKHVFLTKFLSDKPFQHFTFFLIIALFFLWSARAGVKEGLNIHFLGLTGLTLIYGWRVAFILTIPLAIALVVSEQLILKETPLFLIFSSWFPIIISHILFSISYHYL